MKNEKYFIHDFLNDRTVRVLLINGRHWFSAKDIYGASFMSYPKKLKDKLQHSEMYKRSLDGQRMTLVSSPGLLALIPAGGKYGHIREKIVDMIIAFPDEPGARRLWNHPVITRHELKE